MILAAGAPLEPFGRPLRALYVSLNSPVITLESLPTGPARAGVALHEAGATLCVRSERTGQLKLFATTEELAGDRRVALDAALSFAESMGFLFDEDEVASRGDAGAQEAALVWLELCGEEPEPGLDSAILLDAPLSDSGHEAPPEPEAPPADAADAAGADDDPGDPPRAAAGAEEDEVLLPPAHVLSKFRRSGAPSVGAGPAGTPDVRLQLVSRF